MGQLKQLQPLPSVTGKGQQINTCSFSTQSRYAACYKENHPCSAHPLFSCTTHIVMAEYSHLLKTIIHPVRLLPHVLALKQQHRGDLC